MQNKSLKFSLLLGAEPLDMNENMETRLCADAVLFALPMQETKTVQTEELSSSEKITELFVSLEQDDWNSVFQIIDGDPNGIINYTGKYRRGFSVLHYAVDRGKLLVFWYTLLHKFRD